MQFSRNLVISYLMGIRLIPLGHDLHNIWCAIIYYGQTYIGCNGFQNTWPLIFRFMQWWGWGWGGGGMTPRARAMSKYHDMISRTWQNDHYKASADCGPNLVVNSFKRLLHNKKKLPMWRRCMHITNTTFQSFTTIRSYRARLIFGTNSEIKCSNFINQIIH